MTTDELAQKFETLPALRFSNLTEKLSKRADLHAFLLLEKILPDRETTSDFICSAQPDQFYLNVDLHDLAKVITDYQIRELSGCGVFVDEESLSMFV